MKIALCPCSRPGTLIHYKGMNSCEDKTQIEGRIKEIIGWFEILPPGRAEWGIRSVFLLQIIVNRHAAKCDRCGCFKQHHRQEAKDESGT